jgi:SAM-dependent methyltransferase
MTRLGTDTASRWIERQVVRIAYRSSAVLPVQVAALPFAITRYAQGARQEAAAHAWLAGLLRQPPREAGAGHTADFDSSEYFDKLEDADYATYIRSNADLVEWSTPDRFSRICDLGCGRGFLLKALTERGYRRLNGYEISAAAVRHRITPQVDAFTGWDSFPKRSFDTVCLIFVLGHIDPSELETFVEQATRIADRSIVCCIPVYPNNLQTFFDRDLTHRTLHSRLWWDRLFARFGFEHMGLPAHLLPYVEPFVYRRRSDAD